MKKIIRIAIVLFAIVSGTVNAQTVAPKLENSLLWEISGNGLGSPSYLYGTMHMMCENEFQIKDKVKSAFEKTSKVALELDYDNPDEIHYMQKMATSAKPLSTVLSSEAYKELDQFLKLKLGVGASHFENSSLVMIISSVMLKNINCSPKMFEFEFMKLAGGRDMDLVGLEKAEDQDIAFKQSYTDEDYIDQLKFYDSQFFKSIAKDYNDENLMKVYTILTDKKIMGSNARNLMLDTRNKNWVGKMPKLMHENAVFFAVGAAHLPGNNGLVNLLREAGYTVKPIFK